jgi:hypothetical protein
LLVSDITQSAPEEKNIYQHTEGAGRREDSRREDSRRGDVILVG